MKMTKVAPRLLMTRMTFKIWWRMQFIDFPLEIMIQVTELILLKYDKLLHLFENMIWGPNFLP